MVKKIKYLSVFLLLALFISKNSIAEDNPDLNPDSSGGAKFVMQSTDVLKVESDTASSADVYVSVVDSISA